MRFLQEGVHGLYFRVRLEARKEQSRVVLALYECMDDISVRLHGGEDDRAMLVFLFMRLSYWYSSTSYRNLEHFSAIFNCESNILHSIAVLSQMLATICCCPS